MCFASSVVEAHRKLFLSSSTADNRIDVKQTPTTRKRYDSNKQQTAVANSLLAFPAANLKMSRSKTRPLTEECGDCGASGMNRKYLTTFPIKNISVFKEFDICLQILLGHL